MQPHLLKPRHATAVTLIHCFFKQALFGRRKLLHACGAYELLIIRHFTSKKLLNPILVVHRFVHISIF